MAMVDPENRLGFEIRVTPQTQAQIRMKQQSVQDSRQEKLKLQQTTIEFRREQVQLTNHDARDT